MLSSTSIPSIRSLSMGWAKALLRSIWIAPRIPASGLLSSWAAPAITSPRVVIFSDWISLAWASFRCRVFSSTIFSNLAFSSLRCASTCFRSVTSRSITWIASCPWKMIPVAVASTSMIAPSLRTILDSRSGHASPVSLICWMRSSTMPWKSGCTKEKIDLPTSSSGLSRPKRLDASLLAHK